MIDLRFKADFSWHGPPVVLTLVPTGADFAGPKDYVAQIEPMLSGGFVCRSRFGSFSFTPEQEDSFDGDIVLCIPQKAASSGCLGQIANTTRSH